MHFAVDKRQEMSVDQCFTLNVDIGLVRRTGPSRLGTKLDLTHFAVDKRQEMSVDQCLTLNVDIGLVRRTGTSFF